MQFEGFMAYSGAAAHTKGFANRRKRSMEVLAGARESRELALKSGLPVNLMSGGSTGTYNIDHETGLTELEAVLMPSWIPNTSSSAARTATTKCITTGNRR
jgi:D-serine deaminase-like pyridoxal phosphate-dependent protein